MRKLFNWYSLTYVKLGFVLRTICPLIFLMNIFSVFLGIKNLTKQKKNKIINVFGVILNFLPVLGLPVFLFLLFFMFKM